MSETATAPERLRLDELEFLRLTSAHGEIFETEARYRAQAEGLATEAKNAISTKQQAFDARLRAVLVRAGLDAATVTSWDKDTCELILNGHK